MMFRSRQSSIGFLRRNSRVPIYGINQSIRVAPGVRSNLVREAVGAIVMHHDALRMRYERHIDGWHQHNLSEEPTGWWSESTVATVADIPAAAEALQATLDLKAGPLLRVAYLHIGDGTDRLLWILHHLVVDGVSWRLLLDDLELGYQQLARGEMIQLPPKSASLQQWAAALTAYARSGPLREQGVAILGDSDFKLAATANGQNANRQYSRILRPVPSDAQYQRRTYCSRRQRLPSVNGRGTVSGRGREDMVAGATNRRC